MCEELPSCCQAHLWHTHTHNKCYLLNCRPNPWPVGAPGWVPAFPAPRLSLNLVIFFILLLLSFQPAGSYVMLVMKIWSSSGTSLRPSLHLWPTATHQHRREPFFLYYLWRQFYWKRVDFWFLWELDIKTASGRAVKDTEGDRFLFMPGLWRWARDMDLLCAVWQRRFTDTRLTSTTRDRMTSSVNSGQQSHIIPSSPPLNTVSELIVKTNSLWCNTQKVFKVPFEAVWVVVLMEDEHIYFSC